VVAAGPSEEVIRTYLARAAGPRSRDSGSGVFVSDVRIGDGAGPRVHFASGERAVVDVDVVSRGRFERLAVVVGLRDPHEYNVFNASSESLTGTTITLEPDQAVRCTFELQLHLAPGRYRFVTWVFRYDNQKQYDYWDAAGTIFVSHETDVRGVANLYPTVRIGAVQPAPAAPGGGGSVPAGL
jgi:hypothetical protein